jgi:deoxyribonuclease V
MKTFPLPDTLEEAMAVQVELAGTLKTGREEISEDPVLVAGMDASYGHSSAYAAIVIMGYPDLTFQSRVEARSPTRFPYVPGFFAFREIPALLEAYNLVGNPPGVLLVHGHGYSHPRRAGIAIHLGAFLGIPSIGVAGRPLPGMEVSEPGESRGACSEIIMEEEVTGVFLRTQEDTRPVYISAGYRTTLTQAIRIALSCCRHSRFPEPIRLADRAAGRMRRRHERNILQGDQV